ncbi:putative fatty acyl-CoA reductase CG8306 isoform X2 [Macrosteles quadrilineatus]|nr:putative fatty acyl-CoA reductase CG8306 isoform X2 [Macrosteles quadrilineatus]
MIPKISDYMAGSSVLVTGVTGFVGLALVEKLIRCVPDLANIYVLIRPKRGKSKEERYQEIMSNKLFETIKQSDHSSSLRKVVPIEGSIDENELGLCEQDLQTVISSVNYVFHCAATLDFEASLKTTMEINVLGTRQVVDMCKRMRNLKCLVQVSSAYANANLLHTEEILYPPPDNVEKIIEMVQTLSNTELEEITPKVLKKHPNTYTFTKALAEHEVAKEFSNFPSCIVRPSMIVGTWKDPVPGWTNSKNGPTGFFQGAATGVVRRLPVAKHLVYDYIPVDIVINAMISGAVYTASQWESLDKTPIFHVTSSTYKPFRWAMVEDKMSVLLQKYPLKQAVWYPYLKLVPSLNLYYISAFIFHLIPAYFFDTLAKFTGQRPKLVRLHTAIGQSLDRLAPFIFTEWMFENTNLLRLHKALHTADNQLFTLDIGPLDWEAFFEDMAKGVRRYLCKEEDSTLPSARKKAQWLKLFNFLLQVVLFYLLLITVRSFGNLSYSSAFAIMPIFGAIYFYL